MENKLEISSSSFSVHWFKDGTLNEVEAIGLRQDLPEEDFAEYFTDDEAKELRDFLNEVFPNE